MSTQSHPMADGFPTWTGGPLRQTRPFYWSVRRELQENRYLSIMPLAVAGVALFGFFIATIGRALASPDLAQRRAVLEEPYHFVTALIMGAAFLPGIFYSLEALHGERRDRSILFWKSLPVSDLTAVLSKLSIPLVFLPLFSFAIVLGVESTMLSISSLVLRANGVNAGPLWTSFFQSMGTLLYHLLTVHMLWYAPVYAYLLLVSSWAKRAVFLWAGLPALAIFAIEKMTFGSTHFLGYLGYRLSGPEPFDMDAASKVPMEAMTHLSLARFLTTPGLWGGMVFAAIFIFGAVRLRRSQGPI
ncbi:MAG: ABC transporter permease [Terriglobales bacterium]|jgi:ABC-2 type transport system permease protein